MPLMTRYPNGLRGMSAKHLIVGSTPTRVSIKQYNSYCDSVYGNYKQIMEKSWQGYLSFKQ